LKAKWRNWTRRIWGEDLFRQTQSRLTLLYSGVLMIFLTVFIGIVYILLRYLIMNDQERELRALADMEQLSIQEHIRQNRMMDGHLMETQGILTGSEDQVFTYLLGPKGQLVYGKEAGKWVRAELLERFTEWAADAASIHELTLDVSQDGSGAGKGIRGYRKPMLDGGEKQIRVLLTGRAIMQGNMQVATIFVGTNVSYHYELFDWLLLVLGGLGLLFFLVALVISHHMSKRAMVPVKLSYQRQREFMADASHELRTPLSVMQSSIDSLELEQTEKTDPFVRRLLSNMEDEVKQMTRLTGDLLTLARSDTPEYSFKREGFDYAPYARQVAESMVPVAAGKGLTLSCDVEGPILVHGDPERLRQLLYILLDNAVKYTPEGGLVQVKLSLESGKGSGKLLLLSVSDTGIGIGPEDQLRIFERFYRADKARNRQTGGHGLGLSIAQWIVEGHNGTIRVSSTFGEGSIFTVSIPI
jgi:signal transduction histidine kinase